jgi:hypothetical protein
MWFTMLRFRHSLNKKVKMDVGWYGDEWISPGDGWYVVLNTVGSLSVANSGKIVANNRLYFAIKNTNVYITQYCGASNNAVFIDC